MNKMITVDVVSERLGISEQSTRKWLRDGILKGVRLPSRDWRVLEKDLVDFLNQCYTGEGLPFSNNNGSE